MSWICTAALSKVHMSIACRRYLIGKKFLLDTAKIFEILKKNKNVTTVLPKDVKILEMVPFKLTGDLTELESDLEASMSFESVISNNPGDIVAFMITAVVDKELVEFILEGTVNEKGGVDVIIPKDIAKQLQGKDFLITVLGL